MIERTAQILLLTNCLKSKLPDAKISIDDAPGYSASTYIDVKLGSKVIVIEWHPAKHGFGVSRVTEASDSYGMTAPGVLCSDVESTCEQAVTLLTTE